MCTIVLLNRKCVDVRYKANHKTTGPIHLKRSYSLMLLDMITLYCRKCVLNSQLIHGVILKTQIKHICYEVKAFEHH